MGYLCAVELVGSERRGHIALELFERRRVGGEVDEYEPLENPAMQPAQTQARAVEALSHVRGCAQRAVEPVRPAVIAAREARCVTCCLVADPRAAMPAHVQQGIDMALRIAHDDHGLPRDLEQKEIPGRGYLAVVTDAKPRSQEDLRNLFLIDLRRSIHVTRQRVTGAPAAENTAQRCIHSLCLLNRTRHHTVTGRRRLEMSDAVATATITSAMMIVVMALISGVTPSRTFAKISIGKVVAPGPETKLEMTRSSSDNVKANNQPETSAGSNIGTVMSKKTATGRPPRSMAASSSDSSIAASRERTTITT